MAVIMNMVTLKIIDRSGDTAEFKNGPYIINPNEEMMARVPEKYWKVDGEELREMTQIEKDEYEYVHNSTVYLVATGSVLTKINGHDFEGTEDIINPEIIEGGWEYGKVVNGQLISMDANERAQYDYTHKAEVYLINEKKVLRNVDATLYALDTNAIPNPTIPKTTDNAMDVELKFTEVVEGTIVEMSDANKDIIKVAEADAKAIKVAKEIDEKRDMDISNDLAKEYPLAAQMALSWKLQRGKLTMESPKIIAFMATVDSIEANYPVVQ